MGYVSRYPNLFHLLCTQGIMACIQNKMTEFYFSLENAILFGFLPGRQVPCKETHDAAARTNNGRP